MVKRTFDVLISAGLLALVALPCFIIALIIRLTSPGPALYWSNRVGMDNRIFRMPKFRSMHVGTPALATHLLKDPDRHLTPFGRFLRATSLDELPQLWSVLKGDMSIVGPRPALFNQQDLVELRNQNGVHRIRPGITGWAQVNGRDELSIPAKVEFDRQYVERKSLAFDLQIIARTVVQVLRRRGVAH